MSKHNKDIIDEFKKLESYIQTQVDKDTKNKMMHFYRLRNIRNAIKIIESYPTPIKSGEQLDEIKGIGKGIIDRVNEILNNGSLSELDKVDINKKNEKYIKELEQVIGIGRATALDLINNYKITSVKKLNNAYKKNKLDLSDHIKLGLKYYNIYKREIPRNEIKEIDDYLTNVLKKIDKDLCHVICGSYRRQKLVSNDIDVLLIHKNIKTRKQQIKNTNYLKEFVNKLSKNNFLIDHLDVDYEVKYMGFCKYKKYPVRRIDIMYVPYESYYTALFHFTGSGEFNRDIRQVAKSLDYKLSQLGLFDRNNNMKRIKINSEEDIFKKLNLEYISPEDRNELQ